MGREPVIETAASQPVYVFRAAVMLPMHLGPMVPVLRYGVDPLWTAEAIMWSWASTCAVLTVLWMIFGRVFHVRARPLTSLGGFGVEWGMALLASLVLAIPIVGFELLMRSLG